jgi:hypothetical protein
MVRDLDDYVRAAETGSPPPKPAERHAAAAFALPRRGRGTPRPYGAGGRATISPWRTVNAPSGCAAHSRQPAPINASSDSVATP